MDVQVVDRESAVETGVRSCVTSMQRPLDPEALARQIAVVRAGANNGITEVLDVDDKGLLPDQMRSIDLHSPVRVLVLGGAGHLAGNFLAKGAGELDDKTERSGVATYIMADVLPASSPAVNALIDQRGAKDGYRLCPTTPYINVDQLTPDVMQRLNIDFCIAATPPRVHVVDAMRAMRCAVHTYVEKPAYLAGLGENARSQIVSTVESGHVDLIDFFLYNRPLLDFIAAPHRYLGDPAQWSDHALGAVRFIHATCLEPRSVNDEGPRKKMLMSFEAQGGFLWADQAPHPQAMLDAVLMTLFGRGLAQSELAMTFRARDTSVAGPAEAETSAAALRLFAAPEQSRASIIELLGVVGKGLQVPGGRSDTPCDTYMLTVGCERGQVDICIGNGPGTIPSYIALIPYDTAQPTRLLRYANSGLGYSLFLADAVIAAQSRRARVELPESTRARLQRQTQSSLAGMRTIEEVYSADHWGRSAQHVQRYGPNMPLKYPRLPRELPLACAVHRSL